MTAPARTWTPWGEQPAPVEREGVAERDAAWLARPFNEGQFRAAAVAVIKARLCMQDNRRPADA